MTAINGITAGMAPTSSAVNIGIFNPYNAVPAENTSLPAAQSLTQNSQQAASLPANVLPEAVQALIQSKVSEQLSIALKNMAAQNATQPTAGQMNSPANQAENGLGEKKNSGVATATSPAPNPMPESVMNTANASATQTQENQATEQVTQSPVEEATVSYEEPQKVNTELFVKDLNSEDYSVQNKALLAVSKISQLDKAVANQLNSEDLLQAIANIINKDTSNLEGPSQDELLLAAKIKKGEQLTPEEQARYDVRSPKEQAEKNKVYAILTLAQLQKNLRDEIDETNEQIPEGKEKVAQLKMPELIGFKEIMNAVANSEVPAVRKAGIQAISYVAKPEEANGIIQILNNFTNDKDATVREAALKAIEKANKSIEAKAAQL